MKRWHSLLVVPMLLAAVLSACDEDIGQPGTPGPVKEIRVAYDSGKARLFEELLNSYNSKATIKARGVKLEIQDMADAVAKGDLTAISPDSGIWLEGFDAAWQAAHPGASPIVGTTIRYATTPVVIATWAGREGELGTSGTRGWSTLLERSSRDPDYRWSHGSPRASASGMLALVAEFYAGAKKTFGLTKSDADREEVRQYVAQIEKTIARYGGESDAALVEYLLKEGQKALSAIVMPEAALFDFNSRTKADKLFAIHPVEGTLMLDHPLVLLETAELRPEQRRAFLELGQFLTSGEGQAIVAKHGYRPVDLAFDMSQSPLQAEGISTEPPRLLQMPPAGILGYLRGAWASGLKRRANIILVVDVSGSMAGEKIRRTKEALASFIKQVPSDDERIALVTFSSDYAEVVPLGRLGDNRQDLLAQIDRLSTGGNTALFYAVWRAHRLLAQRDDTERINVVVAMTDGNENASQEYSRKAVQGIGNVPEIVSPRDRDKETNTDTGPLRKALEQNGGGILVFTVGYGSDADLNVLSSIASPFGGQAYRADTDTIRRLYELISQNF